MITSSAGLIGFLDSLETLHEVFTDEKQQEKLFDLSGEFGGWRRCKGDGNCFYRACGFAVVEATLCSSPKKLSPIVDRLDKVATHEVKDLITILRELTHLEKTLAIETWTSTLLTNANVDSQLVRLMRRAAACWLGHNKKSIFKQMSIDSYVQSEHKMAFDTFLKSEVMTMGKEADLIMIHATLIALNVKVEIIQLDKTPGPAQRHFVPDEVTGSPMATLLFRPGHYDIFYRRPLFKELASLEDQLQIKRQCSATGGGAVDNGRFGSNHGKSHHSGSYAPSRSVLQGRSLSSASPEEAADRLKHAIRDSFSKCIAVVDRESNGLGNVQKRLEEDRQACESLEFEIDDLTQRLILKQERAQKLQESVHRLVHGGGWGFSCCSGTASRSAELNVAQETVTIHSPNGSYR